MLITETVLTVPAGNLLDPDIKIDLAAIQVSEVRQDEVARVTAVKAPELLAEFNRSWRGIMDIVSLLEKEKNRATKEADKRKGVLLLEVIPERLKSLGIASSADNRQAVIDTDDEYGILTDRLDQIKAAIMFIKGKLTSFENAFTSVKKIMGESTYNHSQHISGDTSSPGGKSYLRAGDKSPSAPATQPKPEVQLTNGFGTARFDR